MKEKNAGISLDDRLRDLLRTLLIPSLVLVVITLVTVSIYNFRYSGVSDNIARASQFNQDFKDDVDLKMYYFAVDSEYATGIPIDEVDTALELAYSLRDNTTSGESRRAINSFCSLCESLKESMLHLEKTADYEERMAQLESNIYILTELIQNYMYTYLYHEAGWLNSQRSLMNLGLFTEMAFVLLSMGLLTATTLRKSQQIRRSIAQPIDALYRRVQELGESDLSPKPPIPAEDRRLNALGEGIEEMAGRLSRQMELNRHEAEHIRSMELMLLQSQMNPHFLYNTLDTIVWLIEMNMHEQAVEMVSSLSNFFRLSLNKGRDVITLREEELHIRSYLDIQHVRYSDVLTYDISMDPALGNCRMPKLTLQPLVENALYHGIKLKRGMGHISIESRLADDGRIKLTVADTGVGMSPDRQKQIMSDLEAEQAPGFGLSAVYKRLKLMFGDRCSFDILSIEGKGTSVTILIPFQSGGEEAGK